MVASLSSIYTFYPAKGYEPRPELEPRSIFYLFFESIRFLIAIAAVGLKPQAQVTKSAKAD
jgi:hypothetical protein